jgi:hypothetical protein
MEQAKAAFNSSAYKEAKKAGDKYAKFRVYAVEGLSLPRHASACPGSPSA